MARKELKIFVIFVFLFLSNVVLYAQQAVFSLTYNEWPNGDLTYNPRHYILIGQNYQITNDNTLVRGDINKFNSLIQQYNAIPFTSINTNNDRSTFYAYQIKTNLGYMPGAYGVDLASGSGTTEIPAENYTTYYCTIYKLDNGAGTTGTSSPSNTYSPPPSSSSSSYYSPANSSNYWIGYNYSYGFPVGITIGFFGFYTSLNFNMSTLFDGATTGSSIPDGLTGKTTTNGLEFTIGYSFKLIDGRLRLPVGIGMSMTDEYQYYRDSSGNEGWYGSGNLEDKKVIVEAGLQLFFMKFLYLSSTYRLKAFSESGFTIGAGISF